MEHRSVRWLVRFILLFFFLLGLLLFVKLKVLWMPIMNIAKILLLPLLLAFLLAYILHPCVHFFARIGLKKNLGILFIFLLLFLLIASFIYTGIPRVIDQLVALKKSLPLFLETYHSLIHKILNETSSLPPVFREKVTDGITYFENRMDKSLEIMFRFLSAFVQNFLVLLLVPFLAYYMLKDYEPGIRRILLSVPVIYRHSLHNYISEADDCIGKYIRSQLLISLFVGTAASIVFYILKIDYALIFGAVIGLTNIIPYFGPIIGALPVLLFTLTISEKTALFTLIAIVLIQFLESSVLAPMITSKTIDIHPITVILLLLVGGELWGILGMLIVVPLFAFLKITFRYVRQIYFLYRTQKER